jgi:hypothetical protein
VRLVVELDLDPKVLRHGADATNRSARAR